MKTIGKKEAFGKKKPKHRTGKAKTFLEKLVYKPITLAMVFLKKKMR